MRLLWVANVIAMIAKNSGLSSRTNHHRCYPTSATASRDSLHVLVYRAILLGAGALRDGAAHSVPVAVLAP